MAHNLKYDVKLINLHHFKLFIKFYLKFIQLLRITGLYFHNKYLKQYKSISFISHITLSVTGD